MKLLKFFRASVAYHGDYNRNTDTLVEESKVDEFLKCNDDVGCSGATIFEKEPSVFAIEIEGKIFQLTELKEVESVWDY